MKRIGILGSTGSIGTQTLEAVDNIENETDIRVTVLSANRQTDLLEEQARKYRPSLVAVFDEKAAEDLKISLGDTDIRIVSGMEGLLEAASFDDMDMLVTGIVGMIGIEPTIRAIEAGKEIALANKETLVTAGHLIIPLAKKMNTPILPVDSEHSAIFQTLRGNSYDRIRRIWLTASGGPFFGKTKEELAGITPADALDHPTWKMGAKVTIDSSTLANKGLEVMEAGWLFGLTADQINVIIQRGSYVHSMTEFVDGSVIAQLATADMRIPIQYALTYPDRLPRSEETLDFYKIGRMTFDRPDTETFPALQLAFDAMRAGGSMPVVFNAANEAAVENFLKEKIPYPAIPETIARAMEAHRVIPDPDLPTILALKEEIFREYKKN